MKNIIIILFILFIPFPSLLSQDVIDNEELFDDAEFFFATEEYEEAFYLFKQLLIEFPDNSNLNYRAGMSVMNVEGKEKEALPYFLKAVKNTTLKYKERDFELEEAPHHAWYYLGNAYRINNELNNALESYATFQDIKNFEKEYNIGIVEKEIKACERGKIIKDNPVNLLKENLGELINTGAKAYQPVVNIDETVLCYMQEQKFYNAIMYSQKKDGKWSYPMNISPQIGSDGDMSPTALSADGTELFLVQRTNSSNGTIYYSKKIGDFWSKAEKLGKNINTMSDEAHASLSSNGKKLLFSSARKGGVGGLDLYISNRMPDKSWGPAKNLGSIINSISDETSAYFLNKDSLIYFSSQGHFNMGGFDIFYSKKGPIGNWIDPVNIGYPLNTTNDNLHYQPVGKGNTGYYAFYGEESNHGIQDIYRVETLPFTAPIVPDDPIANKDFTIILENSESGELIEINYNRKTDNFIIKSNQESNLIYKLKKD